MFIYFPIEIQARELPTRLALSLKLIELGHKVLICDQRQLNQTISKLPPGVVFHKDTSDCNAGKLFKLAKENGHQTAALDEEGLVYFSEDAYKKSRLGEKTLPNTDLLFCWGPSQAKIIQQIPGLTSQIILSGHPKFEIQQNRRNRTQKNSILVNTRFGSVNNGLLPGVDQYIKRMKLVDEVKDDSDEAFRRLYFEFISDLMSEFMKMIEALSNEYPAEKIIIRPHPVESRKIYEELSLRTSNVTVSPVGQSLEDDLSAAKLLIHNGCSTGIEALAMGKPVLVYEPIKTPSGDMALPNNFGLTVRNYAELSASIKELDRGHFNWQELELRIQNYVSNFTSGSPAEIIADAIDSLKLKSNGPQTIPARCFRDSFLNRFIMKIPQKLLFGFLQKRYDAIMYTNNKNPDLTTSDLLARINDFKGTFSVTDDILINKLSPKTYIIEKKIC